jgi:Lrp/AsnC family transcriptional regulator
MDIKKDYRKVLYQLEKDGRKSLTDIGKASDKSQQSVSYAVNQMEDEGVIRSYYPLFDYTKFGFNGYLALFRVNTFSREKIEELVSMFRENEMVAWIQRLAGGWDLLVFFLAPNTSYFNKEFKSLVSEHPEQLRTYSILTSVVIHDLERTFLNEEGEERPPDLVVGGDRKVFEITEEEKDTCEVLSDNPRESTVEMGEKLGVTSKTVIERRKSLEDRKLIKGYRPLLGIKKLDISVTLLLVSYTKQDVEMEDELVEYCKAHENVTLLMKTFGDWDSIIRLETDNREQKQEVVQSLRERFEEIIMDYDTLEVLDDIQKKYLPQGYFDPEAFQPVEVN